MNIEIDRLAITLDGASATLGREVADQLAAALRTNLAQQSGSSHRRLAALDRLDLGAIDVPARADAAAIARLIATTLGDWLSAGDDGHGRPPQEKP